MLLIFWTFPHARFGNYLYYLFPNDPDIFPAKAEHEGHSTMQPGNRDRFNAATSGGICGGTCASVLPTATCVINGLSPSFGGWWAHHFGHRQLLLEAPVDRVNRDAVRYLSGGA
jgi:hypothetical protein